MFFFLEFWFLILHKYIDFVQICMKETSYIIHTICLLKVGAKKL